MYTFDLLQHLDNVFTADEQEFFQKVLIETEEHKKRTQRVCRIKTCSHQAHGYGYCIAHTKVCKVEGCTKRLQSKGLCFRHGGGQRCKALNCKKSVQRHGFCIAHGGQTGTCSSLGCDRTIRARGLCSFHDRVNIIINIVSGTTAEAFHWVYFE